MSGNQARSYRLRAVGNEAGSLLVNLLCGFQVSEGSFGAPAKILGRRVRVVAWTCRSTFIEAKTANAFSRQVVRQHEKRAMSNDRFIAIVRPGIMRRTAAGNGPGAAEDERAASEIFAFFRSGRRFPSSLYG